MRIVTFWPARATSLVALALVATFVLSACARAPSSEHLADPDLTPAHQGNFDHVLLPPDTRLPRFTRVYIEEPEVVMSDYWLTSRRSEYTRRDLERIERDYSRLLYSALARGLTRNTGVVVTDSAEEAEVIFRPVLRSLNIYSPDLASRRTRDFGYEAGNGTFDLTLLDATTGEVLGQFIDHRETRSLPQIERANRATNYRKFRLLMDRWTHNLTEYLLIGGNVPQAD